MLRRLPLNVALVLSLTLSPLLAQTAGEIYAARFTTGLPAAQAALENLLRSSPGDWNAKYSLASVLLETHATDRSTLDRIRGLLDELEPLKPEQTSGWLPAWVVVRRLQLNQIETEALLPLARSANLKARHGPDTDYTGFITVLLRERDALEPRLRAELGVTAGPKPTARPRASISGDELREDLYTLKNLLATRWAYVDEKARQTGRTLDQLLAEALATVRPSQTGAEADLILRRFVGALEDGHTYLVTRSPLPEHLFPARVIDTTDGPAVAEFPSDETNLRLGDVLITVDGRPVEQLIAEKLPLVTTSTAATRRAAALAGPIRRWPASTEFPVTVRRDGRELSFNVSTRATAQLPWLDDRSIRDAGRWLTTRTISDSVAYVRVITWAPLCNEPAYASPAYLKRFHDEIDAALAPLREKKDVVVDVRGNGGGNDSLCTWFVSHFVRGPIRPYVLRHRYTPEAVLALSAAELGDGFQNPKRTPAAYPGQPGPLSNARLWVLVDEHGFSANDTFLHALRTHLGDRVRLIGRTPRGGIGGPTEIGALRNTGATLTASTCKAFALDGALIECNPEKVDELVRWTPADLAARQDPDLEAAARLITAASRNSPAETAR